MTPPLVRPALLALLLAAIPAHSQDRQWVAEWERAQQARPEKLQSTGRIARPGEPGIPLDIHGRVFERDGVTPAKACRWCGISDLDLRATESSPAPAM